jgi:hypothetical protein
MLLRSLVTVKKRVPSHLHSSFWIVAHRRLWGPVLQRRCFSAVNPPANVIADQRSKPREDNSQRNVFVRSVHDINASVEGRDWVTFGRCCISLGKLLKNQTNPWLHEKVRSDLIPTFQKWMSHEDTIGKDYNCSTLLNKLSHFRFSASRKEENELIEALIDSFWKSEKTGYDSFPFFLHSLKSLGYSWEMLNAKGRQQFYNSVQFYLQNRGNKQWLTDKEFLNYIVELSRFELKLNNESRELNALILNRLDSVDLSSVNNNDKIVEFVRCCGGVNLDIHTDATNCRNRKEIFIKLSHTVLKTIEHRRKYIFIR